jgi:hypothetical protein
LGIRPTRHRQVPRKRDGMVISQCKLLSTLIHEIEYQFGIFTVFISQYVFPLEDGRIETSSSECREAVLDYSFDVLTTEHLPRAIIPCTL